MEFQSIKSQSEIVRRIRCFRFNALKSNLVEPSELYDAEIKNYLHWNRQTIEYSGNHNVINQINFRRSSRIKIVLFIGTITCLFVALLNFNIIEYFLSVRCFVPNNYIVWEATRPISNCQFCAGVDQPYILPNISRIEFLVNKLNSVFRFN